MKKDDTKNQSVSDKKKQEGLSSQIIEKIASQLQAINASTRNA